LATIERSKYKGGSPRYTVRYRTPDGKQRKRTFGRKVDAEQFIATTTVSKATGTFVDPVHGRLTLDALWASWWPTTVNLRASSRARDESYARNHVLPTFGPMQLANIDRPAIQAWVASMSASGLAPATVHKAHQVLAKALRSAVKSRYLASNPCDDPDLPAIEREEMRFLTPSEVAALAEAIDGRYRAMVLLAAYGGLRLGELLALDASQVDLPKATVRVAATLVEVHGHITINPPKTRAGHRTVPLPRIVTNALAVHLGEQSIGPVFKAPEGGYVRASLWRRRFWEPATRGARVAPLRPHDLRHTAVALWIAAGASPNEIAKRAGHASVVTVLDRYGHLLPGSAQRVNDALDRLAEGGEPPGPTSR
jgi:integrase